jgi:hypothetical protein
MSLRGWWDSGGPRIETGRLRFCRVDVEFVECDNDEVCCVCVVHV